MITLIIPYSNSLLEKMFLLIASRARQVHAVSRQVHAVSRLLRNTIRSRLAHAIIDCTRRPPKRRLIIKCVEEGFSDSNDAKDASTTVSLVFLYVSPPQGSSLFDDVICVVCVVVVFSLLLFPPLSVVVFSVVSVVVFSVVWTLTLTLTLMMNRTTTT